MEISANILGLINDSAFIAAKTELAEEVSFVDWLNANNYPAVVSAELSVEYPFIAGTTEKDLDSPFRTVKVHLEGGAVVSAYASTAIENLPDAESIDAPMPIEVDSLKWHILSRMGSTVKPRLFGKLA